MKTTTTAAAVIIAMHLTGCSQESKTNPTAKATSASAPARTNAVELAWIATDRRNSIQAYADFLSKYPNSAKASVAAGALEGLSWKNLENGDMLITRGFPHNKAILNSEMNIMVSR